MQNDMTYSRYHRQIILNGFGDQSQERLHHARVLVIGAGGLSCPALQYLCGAGVGTIGVVDGDVVSLSNLHRQILFAIDDIGKNKAIAAAEHLKLLNDAIVINSYPVFISNENAASLIAEYDYVFDGTDDLAAKYLINDVCVLLGKPLVYGAVTGYEGQVSVFNCKKPDGAFSGNYRDVFGNELSNDNIVNCETAGVLGVLPGQAGILMATELIKLITGIGEVLMDRLYIFNILHNSSYEISYAASGETLQYIPSSIEQLKRTKYSLRCEKEDSMLDISIDDMEKLIAEGDVEIIDIRHSSEQPKIRRYEHVSVEIIQLLSNYHAAITNQKVVLICQSGKRSAAAARELSLLLGASNRVFSLRGGVLQLISENRL